MLFCVTESADEESDAVDITLAEDIIARVSSLHFSLVSGGGRLRTDV